MSKKLEQTFEIPELDAFLSETEGLSKVKELREKAMAQIALKHDYDAELLKIMADQKKWSAAIHKAQEAQDKVIKAQAAVIRQAFSTRHNPLIGIASGNAAEIGPKALEKYMNKVANRRDVALKNNAAIVAAKFKAKLDKPANKLNSLAQQYEIVLGLKREASREADGFFAQIRKLEEAI